MSKDKGQEFQILIQKIKELGYSVEIFSQEKEIAKIKKDDKEKFVVGPLMPLNTTVSARISKNKDITKKILEKAGINTPKGEVFRNWEEAKKALDENKISFP